MAKELSLSEYPETGAGPLRAVSNVGAKGDPAGRAETSHLLRQFLMCDCGPVSRRGSTSSDDTGSVVSRRRHTIATWWSAFLTCSG
jgi:hypothetical protein